jgi:glycosyltransferase involved in cell wall biosynthesis
LASVGRVLIIVENLTVPFDRRVWLEAQALTGAGFQVSVICPKGEQYTKSVEVLEGIRIYRYPTPPPTKGWTSYVWEFVYCWFMTAWLSLKVHFREGFDVIHACNPPDTFFALARLYKVLGKKFVYDQHDLCPELYLARFSARQGMTYKLLVALERLTYGTADLVLSTNESYKKTATGRGKVPPEDVVVVRSAPDLRRFSPVEPIAELKRGKKYMVSYLGVMAPQDGVDYFVRSIDHIVNTRKRDDVHFTLIGSGDSYGELRALTTALDLDGYVEFTGRIPDRDVERYLSTSEVCVSPDPKNDLNDSSTMNKVLEYMALGRPIVAFDLKETRYSAGEGALYASANDYRDFGDKILELLDDEERRTAMGEQNSRRLRESLSWDSSKKCLLDAYEMLRKGSR